MIDNNDWVVIYEPLDKDSNGNTIAGNILKISVNAGNGRVGNYTVSNIDGYIHMLNELRKKWDLL